MVETRTLRSWQEILGAACDTPQKKQEIARKIGFVTERTLSRWIKGESNPQKPEAIRLLGQILPEMSEALEEAFPDAFIQPRQPAHSEPLHIPFEFCWRIIDTYAHVPRSAQHWTVFHLVAGQLLPQLDTGRVGMLMCYVRPMVEVATQGNQAEIYFEESAGTGSWTTRQMQRKTCADPWLVQAIEAARPFFIQSCSQDCITPPSCLVKHDVIQSLGFFPVYCGGISAGGMLLCSAQEDFFTPFNQTLIEKYSCLMSLGIAHPVP